MNQRLSDKLKSFLLFNLIIPASFFIFAICFMPIEQVFQFDSSDEGIELIKTSLHLQGFALYTEIWNDQPPLSTIIFAYWFRWFGESILSARLLVLGFSTILIWSFCQTLRIYVGNVAAIIGAFFLTISCNFLRVSVSAMIGQPALAMAMLSIYTLVLYKQKVSKSLLIISGICLALSLQIKLFTAFLIVVIIIEIVNINLHLYKLKKGTSQGSQNVNCHSERSGMRSICRRLESLLYSNILRCYPAGKASLYVPQHDIFVPNSDAPLKKHIFIDIMLWLTSLVITFLIIGFLCNSLSYEQLLHSHFDESVKTAFDTKNSRKLTLLFLLQDFDYILLAIPAIIIIFKNREWEKSFPIVWLVTAFILLLKHQPVWYHHYLLLSVPLTWLATYGVKLSFDFLKLKIFRLKIFNLKIFKLKNRYLHFKAELNSSQTRALSRLSAWFLIFSILIVPIKLGVTALENNKLIEESKENRQILNVMSEHKKDTQWVFTDCPMYAFYLGLRVPPEVAVLSHIRINSNTITREQLITVLEKYRPEQALLCKSRTIENHLNNYISQHYTKTFENGAGTYYLLKDKYKHQG